MEGKSAESVGKGIKQIGVIDMANIETRMRANKWGGKKARKQTNKQKVNKQDSKQKGVVHEGQM